MRGDTAAGWMKPRTGSGPSAVSQQRKNKAEELVSQAER